MLNFAAEDNLMLKSLELERKNVKTHSLGPSMMSSEESQDLWTLNATDVECLAIGAGILGCGGGGNPHLGKLRLLSLLENGKAAKVVPLSW